MNDLVKRATSQLVSIINSKTNNNKVAKRFVIEELDAARHGTSFVKDKIKSFYFNPKEYFGAMNCIQIEAIDINAPQHFLNTLSTEMCSKMQVEDAAAIRILIVEGVIKHFQLGRFFINKQLYTTNKPLD